MTNNLINIKIPIILLFTTINLYSQYKEDILKNGYESKIINLNDDYEGKVLATLIRKKTNTNSKKAILYIHGYNDYFFQENLGDRLVKEGYNFYALDLRKYGRSILPNQRASYFRDIKEYYPEIDSAINIISKENNTKIIINAHSTGGLIVSNYLNDRRSDKRIVGSILNSPFLDYNVNWILKNLILPFVARKGIKKPNDIFTQSTDDNYFKSLYFKEKGEWKFDTIMKKRFSTPITYGWVRGIFLAQKRVKKESNIKIPVIVFSSDKSYTGSKWSDKMMTSDAILNVNHIQKIGKKLGEKTNLEIINGGMHDLTLSPKKSRENYLSKLIFWCNKITK